LVGLDGEHNALDETFVLLDNNLVDAESYQQLVVDHKRESAVVDPLLLKGDYPEEYHKLHVVVERK
jgi:hypothetical protein